ncbi:MAG: hypothetical protein HRF43_18810, partial [Phycisphaerae bacterium]
MLSTKTLSVLWCVGVAAAPAAAQNLLTNPGFEDGINGWTSFGGGAVMTQGVDNLFGLAPTEGVKLWNMVTSWGFSAGLDGVYQTVNLQPGNYTLLADGQAHNNDAFVYISNDPAKFPADSYVQLAVSLSGGTDPAAGDLIRTAQVTTGARFEQLSLSFTVTNAGPVTVFLIGRSAVAHAGNWEAFDNASLTNDADCLNATTITNVTPSQFLVPPKPGIETLTVTGMNLDAATSFRLVGPTTLTGTVQQPASNNQVLVTFDFSTASFGNYSLVATRTAPCTNAVKEAAIAFNCVSATVFTSIQPRTLVNPINPVQFTITGSNLNKLESLSLKSATGDVTKTPTTMFMSGNDLIAIFQLDCTAGGPYSLHGTRMSDGCANPDPLVGAVLIQKPPPAGGCVWHPWAADWSKLNYVEDPNMPPNTVVPTNWDYTFGQDTLLGLTKDTPTGGGSRA